MTTKDIIHQLQSIREDSAERAAKEDADSVWARDTAALDAAIDALSGQSKRTESALTIFGLTALLGFAAACAGIAVAVCGRTTAGAVLCAAAGGWWLEALIARKETK